MSATTRHKVKSFMIVAMLVVAEGRRIEKKALFSDAANGQTARATSRHGPKASHKPANVLDPATDRTFEGLSALFDDPGFAKQIEAMAGHMDKCADVLKSKPNVWKRANEMNRELDRLMDNPGSYADSILPAQMEAMLADSEFQEQAQVFAGDMQSDSEFQKKVQGLNAAMSSQQTSMRAAKINVAGKFGRVMSDQKFQQHKEHVSNVLDSIVQDLDLQSHAHSIAAFVQSLKQPIQNLNETKIRHVSEQIDAMMANAKLRGMASQVVLETLRNEVDSRSKERIDKLDSSQLIRISENPELLDSIIDEMQESREASQPSLLEVPVGFVPSVRLNPSTISKPQHRPGTMPLSRPGATWTSGPKFGARHHQPLLVNGWPATHGRPGNHVLRAKYSRNEDGEEGWPEADPALDSYEAAHDFAWNRPWKGPLYYDTPSRRAARNADGEIGWTDGEEDGEGPGCSVDDILKQRDCKEPIAWDGNSKSSALTSARGLQSMLPALVKALPKGAVTAEERKQRKKNFSLFFCLAIWYLGNYFYNISNKIALQAAGGPAGFPMTIATLQLGVGSVYALFMWLAPDAKRLPNISFKDYVATLPLSFAAAGAQAASVFALGAGSVSFAQIVKASEPAFAALIGVLVYGTQVSTAKWLTLIPVIGGVALASLGELNFALAALVGASVANVFAAFKANENSKLMNSRSLSKRIGGVGNQFAITTINSFLILVPIMLFSEGSRLPEFTALMKTDSVLQNNLLISGLWSYIYNGFATRVVKKTDPVTRSVASTAGRVVFIVAMALVMKESLSPLKLIGSGMAIGGVYLYSIIDNLVAARKEKQLQREISQLKPEAAT